MEVHDSVLKASELVEVVGRLLEMVLTPLTTMEVVSVVVKDPDVDVSVST